MIASLNGTVVALEAGSAVIDVSGVGYLVQISSATSRSLKLNQSKLLHTSLIVREDAFTLYGFGSTAEQKVFDALRTVTGVGPKSALAVLNDLSVDQIVDAVTAENDSVFKAVSGIGPKTAKLIILTLTGKLTGNSGSSTSAKVNELSSVISALTGLGWNERSAADAASFAAKSLGSDSSTNDLLKLALSHLGSSKSVGASDE